jgi:hypothetical protein
MPRAWIGKGTIADDVQQYHPGYFGKVGMRYFHKQQNHFWKPIINLDKVHTSPSAVLHATR